MWRLNRYSALTLQKLIIQILSQTSSSFGCKRNWTVFERIHTKKRNRLEHQRIIYLIYIHYNLQLKNQYKYFLSCFEYKFLHWQLWIIICFFFKVLQQENELWSHWLCMHWWDKILENLLYEEWSIPINEVKCSSSTAHIG